MALDASEEFVCAGPYEEHRGALHYNWIQRGRSFVPPSDRKPQERAVLLRTEWAEGSGQPSFLNLGDLSVGPKWIELECLSHERLSSGKSLLEEILAGHIVWASDQFKDWEGTMEESEAKPPRLHRKLSRESAEELEALDREMLHRLTVNWLDQPSVDGKLTPRQAIQTQEGREKVIEALERIEYINDQRALDGEGPTMDAEYIRRELGLSAAGKAIRRDDPSGVQNTVSGDE
jgi:hypothetical protein